MGFMGLKNSTITIIGLGFLAAAVWEVERRVLPVFLDLPTVNFPKGPTNESD